MTDYRSMLRGSAAVLMLACATAFAQEPAAEGQRWSLFEGEFLVRNVAVLPMTGAGRQAARDVRIVDGVIVAIDAAGEQPVRGSEVVIDGSGKTLLPGLVDMHVHARSSEPAEQVLLYLAHGVTTVQSMHGSAAVAALRDSIATGDVLGPRFFTTGPTTATERVDSPAKARSRAAAGSANPARSASAPTPSGDTAPTPVIASLTRSRPRRPRAACPGERT